MIVVDSLTKSFRVAERANGTLGTIASLVRGRYRTVDALKGVSFALGEGELLGLIGPNGAGKSTTIKILCGILEPTSGTCEVGGLVPWRERVKHVARIGAVDEVVGEYLSYLRESSATALEDNPERSGTGAVRIRAARVRRAMPVTDRTSRRPRRSC